MSSSARITPEGRLGRIINSKTGISLAGGGYLIEAVGHMIGGDEVAAATSLQKIHKEDVDKMYGVLGAMMSKLIVAGSLLEVEAAMEARGGVFSDDPEESAAAGGDAAVAEAGKEAPH